MLRLSFRKKSLPVPTSTVCMAHRNSIKEISDDRSPFVRKDVFKEYAQRMDERCGNHEDLIAAVLHRFGSFSARYRKTRT